ncbi:MAG: insulinase family protein [Bacteroidales bacterium]|nr:insulinase family protein [Bacteroidales bacterium]
MIDYQKHKLSNGLTVIVNEDRGTPLVTVNTLYGVGARDEDASRTGFAHLFEHLMFGGTERVPDFDAVVTEAGGENNAFTNNDITNYYITLPARNLETALWLESDRMRGIDLSQRALEVQQSVVTEEYNYRYVNRPYGDVWMLLRPLCYKVHPYRWCTIGSDIRHVQEATLEDVRTFFARYYRPDNVILSVCGNVRADDVFRLAEKWYGDIESGKRRAESGKRIAEPEQREARELRVVREVPSDALYMAYPMCSRVDEDFRAADLVSDILSNGRSSRLYNALVKERQLFTSIDAYVTGDADPGLFVVSGQLTEGTDFAAARAAVEEQLHRMTEEPIGQRELEKVVNKFENTFFVNGYKTADRAAMLCLYEWLGHIEWVNAEPALYRAVTVEDVRRVAAGIFRPEHQSVLFYAKGSDGLFREVKGS